MLWIQDLLSSVALFGPSLFWHISIKNETELLANIKRIFPV